MIELMIAKHFIELIGAVHESDVVVLLIIVEHIELALLIIVEHIQLA